MIVKSSLVLWWCKCPPHLQFWLVAATFSAVEFRWVWFDWINRSTTSLQNFQEKCKKRNLMRVKRINLNKLRLSWAKLRQNWGWTEAENGAELDMTETHSKYLIRVKFCHQILTLLFLVVSLLFWGGWGKLKIKSISAQLKLKLRQSLVISQFVLV